MHSNTVRRWCIHSLFVAQSWAEEDGTWIYYDKVSESWKKSGDNWYWLDDNGAMVRNQWVAIENEEAGEDDEPEHYWYYFQANGKAYKRSDSASWLEIDQHYR